MSVLQAMLSTEGPGSGQIEDFKDALDIRYLGSFAESGYAALRD